MTGWFRHGLVPLLLAATLALAGAAVPPHPPAMADICASAGAEAGDGDGQPVAKPTCAACLLSLAALLPARDAPARRAARPARARPAIASRAPRPRPQPRRARAPPRAV